MQQPFRIMIQRKGKPRAKWKLAERGKKQNEGGEKQGSNLWGSKLEWMGQFRLRPG